MAARAVVFGASAAAAGLIYMFFREYRNRTCTLCGIEFMTGSTAGSIRNLRCGHEFHDSCIRAYVHSLRHCTMKCPVDTCEKKTDCMPEAERRQFELQIPEKVYCQICSEIVERTVVHSLPCCHGFCKKCLPPYVAAMKLMDPPPKCPMEKCAAEIPNYVIELIETF